MNGAWLVFAAVCGLLGETVEVARLVMGGMQPPDAALRLTLFVAYAVAGAAAWGAAALTSGERRARLGRASVLFALFLVLPWLNLDYLPRWNSPRTLVLTLVAALIVGALAVVLARFGRLVTGATVAAAVLVHLATMPASRPQSTKGARPAASGPSTNVLLILVDTLRADHLGAYGYARETSPVLNRFARSSVVFERAVAQATWTKPSVASLLTGSFVHRHGVVSSRDALGPDLPTLADVLRRHGYETAGFSSNPWITPEFHFDRGFAHFESGRAMGVQLTNLYRLVMRGERLLRRVGVWVPLSDWIFFAAAEPSLSNAKRDELLTEAVIDWLDGGPPEPFFAYVHLIGPHDPYDPPVRYADAFRDPLWDDVPRLKRPPARVQSIFETAAPLDGMRLASLVAQYDGAIRYTDELLGRLLATVDRLGLDERTMVVITSDHGEEFYEHGNWRHGNQLYDEVVHIPLMIRRPGVGRPERRPDAAMVIDIFPTVLATIGVSPEAAALDGRNLFADDDARHAVYSEHWRFEGGEYVSQMVSKDGWKIQGTRDAASDRNRVELYDLRDDPLEQKNLYGELEGAGDPEVEELEALLVDFRRSAPARHSPEVDIDRSTKERLRALGY